MYGKYDIPVMIEKEGMMVSLKTVGGNHRYIRTSLDTTVEKTLMLHKSEVLIQPVEPLNTPKALTPYLLIEFDHPLLFEPKVSRKVFLTFPVEIAVFLSAAKTITTLDVLSLVPQKFTLYGEPRNGLICKYWKSPVYDAMPNTELLREGRLELAITNTDNEWQEITKTVLNAYGMKLFYNEYYVAMKAKMNIRDGDIAETECLDAAPEKGMKKAQETYVARKLSMTSTNFLMEYGL